MKQFWQNLSDRERALVMGAGILCAVLFLVLFVYLPMTEAREDAISRERAASDSFEQLATLAAEAKMLRRQGTQPTSRSILTNDVSQRVLISRSARQAGITISRIQPTDGGALTLWIDSVPSQRFFAWVKTLDESYGLAPDNVSLQPEADGTVRAQIQFQDVIN